MEISGNWFWTNIQWLGGKYRKIMTEDIQRIFFLDRDERHEDDWFKTCKEHPLYLYPYIYVHRISIYIYLCIIHFFIVHFRRHLRPVRAPPTLLHHPLQGLHLGDANVEQRTNSNRIIECTNAEREREREIYIYIYMYIVYTHISISHISINKYIYIYILHIKYPYIYTKPIGCSMCENLLFFHHIFPRLPHPLLLLEDLHFPTSWGFLESSYRPIAGW